MKTFRKIFTNSTNNGAAVLVDHLKKTNSVFQTSFLFMENSFDIQT